ncbi:MAG: transglutaminase [Ahrensia sp.]|nr:transglutaminase [Ahrensia sp.]
MRFSVRHETLYRYSASVRLGDHLLRLTPRPDDVATLTHAIEIEPAPAWREEATDEFGTPVTRLRFEGEAASLKIVSRFEAEARARVAPPDDRPDLPWSGIGMETYLGSGADTEVQAFARELAAASNWRAGAFLDRLNRTLFERIDRQIRADGDARSAAETLRVGSGACRDFTVLFMEACRSLGIPARFVSGYQAFSERLDGRRHMHAWPEVFLPGHGWRGYDPTHGKPVAGTHIGLAAAPHQAATMPVEGGYWGDNITSTLEYRLEIDAP